MTNARVVAALLCLSAVALGLMIPGGFVENRNFPEYPVFVLAGFNIFLTVLGLGSLILAFRALRVGRVGRLPVMFGTGYIAVYVLDLAHIFPVAEAPMSTALFTLEWIGTLLGLLIVVVSLRSIPTSHNDPERTDTTVLPGWLFPALAIIAVAIVIFATISAM